EGGAKADSEHGSGHNMLIRRPQVAVQGRSTFRLLGNLLLVPAVLVGCESPARVKPWRHAPDPTTEAASAPASAVLADPDNTAEVRATRGHTLRIHLAAEPGRLNPLVAPSVWTRRIVMGT